MTFGWLRGWWRKGGRPAQIVMFTRQGCHLCEVAWEQLERARQTHPLTLEKIDVDGDPLLQAEHGPHVPVVAVNGTVRFRGRINPVLLNRLLRAETGG